MRVFVAGATGAIGKQLIPLLVQAGHSVTGMIRSPNKAGGIWSVGAEAAVANALDPVAVAKAVGHAKPEVIVHQLTAIPQAFDLRKFEEQIKLTNQLRTEGTDNLLAADQESIDARQPHSECHEGDDQRPARHHGGHSIHTKNSNREPWPVGSNVTIESYCAHLFIDRSLS
jgi:nucleoside-diphosphate-sugar epimerase